MEAEYVTEIEAYKIAKEIIARAQSDLEHVATEWKPSDEDYATKQQNYEALKNDLDDITTKYFS